MPDVWRYGGRPAGSVPGDRDPALAFLSFFQGCIPVQHLALPHRIEHGHLGSAQTTPAYHADGPGSSTYTAAGYRVFHGKRGAIATTVCCHQPAHGSGKGAE